MIAKAAKRRFKTRVPLTCPQKRQVPSLEFDLSRLRLTFYSRRVESGLTFDQFAELSGISRQTLLNISSGKHNGDLRTWIKLSLAFGVGMAEMLSDIGIAEDGGEANGERRLA